MLLTRFPVCSLSAPAPQPIYELKKKLLMTRFMKAVNHPDYRSSDFKKLRKAIARLKTAKRFDEMREQGIDPYARYVVRMVGNLLSENLWGSEAKQAPRHEQGWGETNAGCL